MADTVSFTSSAKVTAAQGHVIVCGLGRFGLRIVEHLREQNIPVTVITEKSRQDRVDRAREIGATLIEGDFLLPKIRAAANITQARAIILAASSDAANLEAALEARNEAPQMRIVMRLDADRVAARLCADFDINAALSPPVLAASHFTRAALEPATASPIPEIPVASHSSRSAVGYRHFHLSLPAASVFCLLLLFLAGVLVFHVALVISWVDAIYFTATILTTVGFGDFHLKEQSDIIKLFGTLVMFGGVILIAVTSSFLTNFFLSGGATRLRAERQAARYRNHIIICGLGSVGFSIAEDLIAQGIKPVIIDAAPEITHTRNLSTGVPLLVGDATDPEVLIKAGIDRARSLICAVSNDAVNLEIAFTAQSLVQEKRPKQPLRIVLRCFDPDLARRIHKRSNAYTVLSSAEIAAPLFVTEALKTQL